MVGWRICLRSVLGKHSSVVWKTRETSVAAYSTCARTILSAGNTSYLRSASIPSSHEGQYGLYQLLQRSGISTTRYLLAGDDSSMVPIASPLTQLLEDTQKSEKVGSVSKRLVQAIKKDIKQSPKKVNLVARLVRGMRVEDALMQLQVTIKRASKDVYQVIHSARANASNNHGLDPDKLIVHEAFVGKGLYLKRMWPHAKGRSGVRERKRCRLTVVVRETTPEEEAKIAKLRVSNYKKLTRKEKQLMPHQLIEVTPRWSRRRRDSVPTTAS